MIEGKRKENKRVIRKERVEDAVKEEKGREEKGV